jgi:hypothetical protein
MSAIYRNLPKSAPAILLAWAFALQGAKTPQAFCVWAGIALGLSAWTLYQQPDAYLDALRHPAWLLLFTGVGLGYVFSTNKSLSLYPTTQLLIYLFVWPLLMLTLRDDDRPLFWKVVQAVALISGVLSALQLRRTPVIGWLPINPAFNAMWMASLSLALISRAMDTHPTRIEKWTHLLTAAFLSICIVLSSSRMALLAWVVGALALLLHPTIGSRIRKRSLGLGILGLAIFACYPEIFLGRFQIVPGTPVQLHRAKIWRTGLLGMLDHPFGGYGLDTFEMAYQRHAFPVNENPVRFGKTTEFAHNEFIQLGAELGIPLLVCLLWAFGRGVRNAFRDPHARTALGVVTALCVGAMFNPVWHMPLLAFWTLVWAAAIPSSWKPPAPILASAARSLRATVYGMLVLCAGLAGWFGLRQRWADQGRWDQIVRWSPYDAEALKEIAFSKPDLGERLTYLQKASAASPSDIYLLEHLATALENYPEKAHYERAIEVYTRVLSLAPSRATDALALGRLLFRERHFPAALLWFQAARTIEPNYWESDLWIARTLSLMNRPQEAISMLKQLAARHQSFIRENPRWDDFPHSVYEQQILRYDDRVVQSQLDHFLSRI